MQAKTQLQHILNGTFAAIVVSSTEQLPVVAQAKFSISVWLMKSVFCLLVARKGHICEAPVMSLSNEYSEVESAALYLKLPPLEA